VNLELLAMRWLRWEKRAVIVVNERTPREYPCGLPDVLGVLCSRHLIEIEIKRSFSDFKADFKKGSRRNRDLYPNKFPKQFYYLVTPDIMEKVEPLLPSWAGLMRWPVDGDVQQVHVIRVAPTNKDAARLTPKECAKLVYKMANQIVSMSEKCGRGNHWIDDHWSDYRIEFDDSYRNFQI
jgi:hypothetical protein